MKFVANRDKIAIPADVSVDGSVGIGPIPNGFGIEAELKISLPVMPREQAEDLVQRSHIVCPYSNSTRNNIDVTVAVVQSAGGALPARSRPLPLRTAPPGSQGA